MLSPKPVITCLSIFFCLSCSIEPYGPTSKEEKNDTQKVCVTGGYHDLTESSVTLYGYANLTSDMTGDIKLGIACSTNSLPDQKNGISLTTKDLNSENQFFVSFSGLKSETKYYYRAFVFRNDIYTYGEVKEFTTKTITPSILSERYSIASSAITLRGSLSASPSAISSAKLGFVFGESIESGKWYDATIEDFYNSTSRSFSCTINDIELGNVYYYRAEAVIKGKTIHGEVVGIKDLATPKLLSFELLSKDNDCLKEDYSVETISSNMVLRIPGGGQGKTLVARLTAGNNDVIEVNDMAVVNETVAFDASFPIDIVVTNTKSSIKEHYRVTINSIPERIVRITHVGSFMEKSVALNKGDIRLAINPKTNTPYILYSRKTDYDNSYRLACIEWRNNSFCSVGELGFTDDNRNAKLLDLAFCGNTPYVLLCGETESSVCGVRKYNGSNWVSVGEKSLGEKISTSYGIPQLFFIDGNPCFVVQHSVAGTDAYRNAVRYNYNGLFWEQNFYLPGLPKYGERGGSDGLFYIGVSATDSKENVFLVTSSNLYGYYLFNAKTDWLRMVDNYIPAGEAYGIPSSLSVKVGPDDSIYVLAALSSKAQYQLFRYDKDGRDGFDTYAGPVQMTAGKLGAVKETMRFGISPSSGDVVGIYARDNRLYYAHIDNSLQWTAFREIQDISIASDNSFDFSFAKGGAGYITAIQNNGSLSIELYRLILNDE